MSRIYSSEQVSRGHVDKICDQIADAIVTDCLAHDKDSRVAVEVLIKNETVIIAGEITSKHSPDYAALVMEVMARIGIDKLGYSSVDVRGLITKQSPDIAMGVDKGGAGDQGIMFGYATNETETYMPLPISMAHELVRYASKLRHNGTFKYARPDMKSQVTIDYTDENNPKVDTILMSIQHDPDFNEEEFKTFIKEKIMKEVVRKHHMNEDYKVFINPTGRFVIGGPHGDTGLTGRKIIVDTYGGMARHGGGAFSGKDPSKVDRSAAYITRYIAKNIVAAGLCDRIEIQLSYAIGVKDPTSVHVDTYGTGKVADEVILDAIKKEFDLTPQGIINTLDLLNPIYGPTAAYGHFGRTDVEFPWEKLNKVEDLKKYLA